MAAPVLSSATVSTNGTQVTCAFDQSITGFSYVDFQLVAGGYSWPLRSSSGSGTTWVLVCNQSFIATGNTVKLSYTGTAVINGSSQALATFSGTTVTNSSTISARVKAYTDVQFKAFFHLSGRTFSSSSSTPTQGEVNAWDCASYNMNQWLDTAKNLMHVNGVFLTAKHDFGFSLWPTVQGNFNIGTTAWNTRTPGIDVVRDFVNGARARGLMVGLFYNMYDPWWISVRSGSNGTYSQNSPAFTNYVAAHVTELLSNYGAIDCIWFDSWEYRTEIGYTNCNYATISALVASLQPNCVLINNAGPNAQNSLANTEICVAERQGGSSVPATSNTMAYEYTETSSSAGDWTIPPSNGTSFLTPSEPVATLASVFGTRRCCYLYNLMPDSTGLLPSAMITHAQAVGDLLVVPNAANRTIPGSFRR